jgi:2-polyprenyl-3-methyl-5-hydroxy-6-metoxy-1,4-benzoquinol methylase
MKQQCEICSGKCHQVYSGDIRDGAYGGVKHSAIVYECNECGVQRLQESDCIPDKYYETGEYREKLEESLDDQKAVIEQDEMQHHTLKAFFPNSLRGKFILDVGCGVGSLLDMLKNVSYDQICVEPCSPYLKSLSKRGYKVYPSLSDAEKENGNIVDYAFSIQVIEHVKKPVEFLEKIKKMIKPGGKVLISTPNRGDILMTLLKEEFSSFFYRTQHRWYFDKNSLIFCAERAGFKVEHVKFIHRYGMSNTVSWLRDNKPYGNKQILGITSAADSSWKNYLEQSEQSDCLYMFLSLPEDF